MPKPLTPEEQERLDNHLLTEYKKRKAVGDEGVKTAENIQLGTVAADVLGRGLTQLGNSQNSSQFLYNGIRNLAAKPQAIGGEDEEWDGGAIKAAGDQVVASAKAKRDEGTKDLLAEDQFAGLDRKNRIEARDDTFAGDKQGQTRTQWERENKNAPLEDTFNEQKRSQSRTEWERENKNAPLEDGFKEEQRGQSRKGWDQDAVDRTRKNKISRYEDQDMDMSSPVSKNANNLLKSVLLSKAAEAEKAGDSVSAKAIRAQAAGINMAAREAYDTLKIIDKMDWRAVLGADAAKLRAERKRDGGDELPLDSKHIVVDLAKKNASKMSIANQIESDLKAFNAEKDPKQKVILGKNMLKTLNSLEGPDALANPEFDRLAGQLNFAYGNLTNDNPIQFGRDLEGFSDFVSKKSKALRGSIKSNQNEVDRLMGRTRADTRTETRSTKRREQQSDWHPPQAKRETGRQYNRKLDKTRIIFNDGTSEVVDGHKTRR